MGWQRWHVAPGPQRSPLYNSWLIWNGGELIIILSVPMLRYEWRSCSHESEVASCWRNATGSVPQPWLRGEPTDDGQRGMCSVILCRRFQDETFESE
jgi:hypothetical protein